MKQYHYRFLDKSNKLCRPPMITSCLDDKSAVTAAERLLGTGVVEVWEYERFVARLEPELARRLDYRRP